MGSGLSAEIFYSTVQILLYQIKTETEYQLVITALSVGFSAKNLSVPLPFGCVNFGFRKIAPFAMASKAAGPSYGNPRPRNT